MKGTQGLRVLPPITATNKQLLYDSTVDDDSNPFEFCIFHDTQAYPSHIITFKQS